MKGSNAGASSNGHGAGNGHGGKKPVCKKRMMLSKGSEDGSDDDNFNFGGSGSEDDEDDEYSHGSDCNCGGSDNDDYGDEGDFEGDLNDDEEEAAPLSLEDAMISMKQTQDFLVSQISKLEVEIDKCKKARGPQAKKMKERVTVLGSKVEHSRALKAKVSEIHSELMKGVLPEANANILRNLRGYLTEFINAV